MMGPAALLPLVALPGTALLLQPRLPPWVFMWIMAGSLYAGSRVGRHGDRREPQLAPCSVRSSRLCTMPPMWSP